MIRFSDGLYSDVRLEESCSTLVRFALGDLEECFGFVMNDLGKRKAFFVPSLESEVKTD